MSRVVSGRISNDLYQKIAEDGHSHNDIINAALEQYYSNMSTDVNKQVFEDKYQRFTKLIDGHLKQLEVD